MNQIFHKEWELELQHQYLTNGKCFKRAYVCSPLSADSEEALLENMRSARAYMFYAMKKMDLNASAPHAYLPMLLWDSVPADRALALMFGLRLLEQSDLLLVCGNRLSEGMRGEIAHAISLHMPIITFDDDLFLEVKKEVLRNGGEKEQISLDYNHYLMAVPSSILYLESVGVLC